MAFGSTNNIIGYLADSYPNVLNKTALPIIAQANPTLHMMMGKPINPQAIDTDVPDSMPNKPGFGNLNTSFEGSQFEYRLLMQVDAPQYVGYINPNDSYAATNWGYQPKRAVAKGSFAQIVLPYSFPTAMVDQIAGDKAKCTRFIAEESVAIAEGFEQLLGSAIHGSSDQTDQSISGWQLAMGGAAGSYLGLDLTDPGNVKFTSPAVNVGALTFSSLPAILNASIQNKGRPSLAPCNITDYNKICVAMEGKFTPTDNDDETWRAFRGTYKYYEGVRFVLDPYLSSSGTIPFIDTRYVDCYMRQMGFDLTDMFPIQQAMAATGTFVRMYFGVIYSNPQTCVRAYNIS